MTNVTLNELKQLKSPVVLGAPTCSKCFDLKRGFEQNGVEYEYYDLTAHQDLIDELRILTGGPIALPVVVHEGRVLLQGADSSEINSLPRTLKSKKDDEDV